MMLQGYKLGRVPRPLPDHAPLLARLMRAEAAPARLVRDQLPFRPALDGNDELGNCTAVGLANAVRAQAVLAGYQVSITRQQVIDFYRGSTGYDPGVPATDRGGVEVDVLAYQLRHGLQGDAPAPWYGLWGTIPPDDLNGIRQALARLGCVYLGVDLAMADQGGAVWDTTTPGDQQPGSWGAHCLCAWSYTGTADTDTVLLASWGMLIPATWRWMRSRLREAHGIAHRQILGPSGTNSAGFNWDAMAADCAGFGA